MDCLPEEVIDIIASFTCQGALYNWLRTSKKHYRIVKPHLYAQLIFDGNSHDKLAVLMNNLHARLALADSVRTIKATPCNHEDCQSKFHLLIASCPLIQNLYVAGTNWSHFMVRTFCSITNRANGVRIVPIKKRFLHLKQIELEGFNFTLISISPLFKLPALETLKIEEGTISRALPIDLPRWRIVQSGLKHLHLSRLRLPLDGIRSIAPVSSPIGASLLLLVQCCPRIETLSVTQFQRSYFSFMDLWAPEVVRGISTLPIRKLHLHGWLEGCPSPGIPLRVQPSIADDLSGGVYEELYLDISMIKGLLLGDTATVLPTLKVLRITPDKGFPITGLLGLLDSMPAEKVKTPMPALERLVIHDNSHWGRADISAVMQLAASYSKVGISLTVEDHVRSSGGRSATRYR